MRLWKIRRKRRDEIKVKSKKAKVKRKK